METLKNRLSRDFWRGSIFDFCNKIGTNRTTSGIRSPVATGGKPDIGRGAGFGSD
jgi:hypothetical protein